MRLSGDDLVGAIGKNAAPRLKSGLGLQRCGGKSKKAEDLNLDAYWTAEGLMKIYASQKETKALETIINEGYTIYSFETAFDKWKYDADGREEEVELTGLRGNTLTDKKEIRLREDLTNQEAAKTLFHETGHVRSSVTDGLDQEIAVRVETEKYLIRVGWPPVKPSYRNTDGTVNEAAIRADIMGSSHYNPVGRTRIGRRYVGEKKIEGWKLP